MVVNKPYIHFKINNEPIEQPIDYNYTWATTIESEKGPVNQPTLVSTASQAKAIFGVDMRPYFAQGANALIIVRVTGESDTKKSSKGVYSFNTKEKIRIYRAEQATIETYKVIKKKDGKNNYIMEKDSNGDDTSVAEHDTINYEHKLYYATVVSGTGANAVTTYVPVIEHRDSNGNLIPEEFIDTWHANGRIITKEDVTAAAALPEKSSTTLATNKDAEDVTDSNGITTHKYDPEDYKRSLTASTIYTANQVKPYLTPVGREIDAGSPLFTVTSKYEGDYGITISTSKAMTINQDNDDGYTIVLTDPALGTIRINNGYDVLKIVNRINDKGFNFEAAATNYGLAITEAMHANIEYINVKNMSGDYPTLIIPNSDNISIPEGTFISIAETSSKDITYLTETEAKKIAYDKKHGLSGNNATATVTAKNYAINLIETGNQSLIGGSNGEWDALAKRIPAKGTLQFDAHKKGLDLLRQLRIAGVFCMYGDADIQRAYVEHGIDSVEPEKGMNNNQTCRWRTIILGADKDDRDLKTSLAARAAALDDQYTLLLGQGLIDTGYYGEASNMSVSDRHRYSLIDSHHLLPYECTQYIAGLRAKLNYDESIFGGQGRKRIRGVGDLQIAPLFDYEESYSWDPKTYVYLNESGVLTFTEDYGQITLTDGVTTIQSGSEEDEEGVMNILKYTQNGIYDICLPYIGRNINGDLEQSITMEIQSFLERMKVSDQSIIDTDDLSAYELDVSLGSRNNQLLGRIYIYLKITPVHALRQIEVEMTVQ